jgi:hypothetical protein
MSRIFSVHPLVVTIATLSPLILIYGLDWISPGRGVLDSDLHALPLMFWFAMAVQFAWVWSAYREALAHSRRPAARYRFGQALFPTVAVTFTVVSMLAAFAPDYVAAFQRSAAESLFVRIVHDAIAAVASVGFFICHGLAARALLAAEVPVPRAYTWIGTFFFMLYLFLGVWFLRHRLTLLRYQ